MRSESSSGCSPGTPIQEQEDRRLPDLLRHARESRGLTLEQLASETKIPASRLAAFEHDEVPGRGFYMRAQIRAYARALNVDEHVVLAELNHEPAPAPAPRPLLEAPQTRVPVLTVPRAPVAIALVIVAVVLGRLIASLDFWPARDADVRAVPDSVLQSERPVPTSAAAADVPQVESGLADGLPPRTQAAAEADRIVAAPSSAASGDPIEKPATAGSSTELVVTSEPAGARVTVNGIGWGPTPITIRNLSAGLKRVRVTMDGFVAAEQVVSVGPDRTGSVQVRLSPASE